MVEVIKKGAYLVDGKIVWAEDLPTGEAPDQAREKTIAYSIRAPTTRAVMARKCV